MGAESFFAEDEYQVGHSVRINDDNNAKLAFTPTTNGTSTDVFTISFWFKRGKLGHAQYLFDIDETTISYDDNDFLFGNLRGTASGNYFWTTNAVFRDLSAWYHIVGAYDSTQGTDTNRFKFYVNGVQQTFSSIDYMPQNREMKDTQTHYIGYEGSGYSADGCFAEVNFVDGLAIGPEFFGMTGEFAEEWLPIQYTGAYGTNGFYLTFAGGGVMSASGGNSTATDGDFKAASFTSNGTFTPSVDGFVEYLVIAGGGAGAADGSTTNGNGGGGAGGFRTGMLPVAGGTGYSITVGAGGVGALSANAVTGGNSVFSTITSAGGGGGGYYINTPGEGGGSGGGGGANSGAGGGASPAGQGFAGEAGSSGQGGGGGGAAEAGGTDGTGQGGDGLASSITGSSVTRAGGGAGSRASGGARAGGTGGGGAGGNGGVGGDGSTNTGSGGGAGVSGGESGSGGSGIVIIRYKFQ